MPWFRNALPAEVRSRLDLEPGERVLAHARADEGVLVATNLALHLPDAPALRWERVDHARWSEGVFTVTELGVVTRRYVVSEPNRLPETVQERVNATVVVSQHVPLTAGDNPAGVRFVARRSPGADADSIVWHARFDTGLDPNDPETNQRAGAALADLRDRMGI